MMHKILTIIGARPQIIKAAALSRIIRKEYTGKILEVLVHTGQHYDDNMSDVFFRQMDIPLPDYNLQAGSASHAVQTARMMERMEEVFLKEKPEAVVVYGDTNSTLAAAVTAGKIHIPVIHIEAGLRSFHKAMPEEINRIVADHLSTLLFTPTPTGYRNLLREGFKENPIPPFTPDNPVVYSCGDIMLDNSLHYVRVAENNNNIRKVMSFLPETYILCTIHRDRNTDSAENLQNIARGLSDIMNDFRIPVVFPMHPRTRKQLDYYQKEYTLLSEFIRHPLLKTLPPAGYLEMCLLEKNARLIITDSGGVQKEAYYFHKPCIVLRNETEWVEPVELGSTILAGTNPQKIRGAAQYFLTNTPVNFPPIFGDGKSAGFIAGKIYEFLSGGIKN